VTGYLLDTNIISEPRRPQPLPALKQFLQGQARANLFISAITLAEIRYGIEIKQDPAMRAALTTWLDHGIRPMFGAGRVLAATEDIMLRWRLLVAQGRVRRHTYPQPDLIIAATALEHGLTLVTRNASDFAHTGVAIYNPWVDPLPPPSRAKRKPSNIPSP
jgi:toxin FitB